MDQSCFWVQNISSIKTLQHSVKNQWGTSICHVIGPTCHYDVVMTSLSYHVTNRSSPLSHWNINCRFQAEALRIKYYAIEIDPSLTAAQKVPYMIEW